MNVFDFMMYFELQSIYIPTRRTNEVPSDLVMLKGLSIVKCGFGSYFSMVYLFLSVFSVIIKHK